MVLNYNKAEKAEETDMANQILSRETEKRFFQDTLLPIFVAGESVTVFWAPSAGRRRGLVYLSENSQGFDFKRLGKYKIYFINPDELTESGSTAYFKLMLSLLNPTKKTKHSFEEYEPYYLLTKELQDLLYEKYHIIFILGRFDELSLPPLFYNNLYSLWQLDKTRVHFLFATVKDIFQDNVFETYDQLKRVVSQNVVYFPLLNRVDSFLAAQEFYKRYGYRVDKQKLDTAISLSGGNASIIKVALRSLSKNPNLTDREEIIKFLSEQLEIKIVMDETWEILTEEEKSVFIRLAAKLPLSYQNIPDRLMKLGLVVREKGENVSFFSPIFESYVKEKGEGNVAKPIEIDKQTGEILIDGKPAKEKITLQEYHLLSTFLGKPNVILSRDDIGQTLWGEKSYDKYSDWAIDQTISQLRKKISLLGIPPKNLQTIRGRGYRWISK